MISQGRIHRSVASRFLVSRVSVLMPHFDPRNALSIKCCFFFPPPSSVILNIRHANVNMNSAVCDLWPRAAAKPLMTLEQLWLLFSLALVDAVRNGAGVAAAEACGASTDSNAGDSVIRDPQRARRGVRQAVNTLSVCSQRLASDTLLLIKDQ